MCTDVYSCFTGVEKYLQSAAGAAVPAETFERLSSSRQVQYKISIFDASKKVAPSSYGVGPANRRGLWKTMRGFFRGRQLIYLLVRIW